MTQLTEQEIDALPAGYELNTLIAIHLFNLQIHRTGDNTGPGGFTYIDRWGDGEDDWAETFGPDYSGTWNGMGLVAMHVHLVEGWVVRINLLLGDYFECHADKDFTGDGDIKSVWGRGDTPMLAVCKAALKIAMLGKG